MKKVKGSDAEAKTNGVKANGQKEGEDDYEFRHISLGAKNTASMQPGERIIVMTPGGGGWGPAGKDKSLSGKDDPKKSWKGGSVSSRQAEAEASA